MRWRTKPGHAACCGQMFLARRTVYEETGGHAAIKASLMDGIALPRAMRNLGLRTDLIDAMQFAECRIYHNAHEVLMRQAKNASEGIESPEKIVPITLVLLVGQVLPVVVLAFAPILAPRTIPIAACAVLLAYLPRIIGTIRCRESIFGALLHPVSISLLLAIQWFALMRSTLGLSTSWRGRSYGLTAELVEHRKFLLSPWYSVRITRSAAENPRFPDHKPPAIRPQALPNLENGRVLSLHRRRRSRRQFPSAFV